MASSAAWHIEARHRYNSNRHKAQRPIDSNSAVRTDTYPRTRHCVGLLHKSGHCVVRAVAVSLLRRLGGVHLLAPAPALSCLPPASGPLCQTVPYLLTYLRSSTSPAAANRRPARVCCKVPPCKSAIHSRRALDRHYLSCCFRTHTGHWTATAGNRHFAS